MSDLRELYQEVIFDHNKSPRNFGRLENANRRVEGYNPLCGDKLTLYLDVDENDVIHKVCFDGHGCAISIASASIMTTLIEGRTTTEATAWFDKFHAVITGSGDGGDLGKLEVLSGVRQYPMRVKCATLPWHTLRAALQGGEQSVTTE